MQGLGPSLLRWKSTDSSILTFCEVMHAALVSELQLIFREEAREDRESHLQRIVTAYMVFAPLSVSVGMSSGMIDLFCLALTTLIERCNFDENMANLFRKQSPPEFSSCLRFVFEALSSKGVGSDDFARLIRLISLAFHNAPESQSCFLLPLIRGNSCRKHRHTKDRSGLCQGVLGCLREQRILRCLRSSLADVDFHQRFVFQKGMSPVLPDKTFR